MENLHRHLIIMIVFQNVFDMTGKCCLIGLRIAGISADNVSGYYTASSGMIFCELVMIISYAFSIKGAFSSSS